MKIRKNKLTVIMFVLAMTSTVCSYSQSDNILISGTTMTADERQQEIFQELKTCFEVEDVRVIQSKNFDVLMEWGRVEAETRKRRIVLHLNKETNVYIAVSQLNPHANKTKKKPKEERKSKERPEWSKTLNKVESCLANTNMLVIETKDINILQQWIKEDEEGRNVSTHFNAETGVYTAISTPKMDGNGKVLFRKID